MDLEQLNDDLAKLRKNATDPDAWESMYQLLWPYLVGVFFRSFVGKRQTTEDAAQEVMLRLLRFADFQVRTQSGQAFLSYVNAVCRSVAIDSYRREASQPSAERVFQEDFGGENPDPEKEQITRDLVTKVAGRLSQDDLKVAYLIVDGRPADEAAAELHVNLTAYYQRVSRLRRRVRSILEALSGTA